MTDGLMTNRTQRNLILNENDKYKDIRLQPLKGGRGQFGFRFLDQIKWAAAKFNFQYLLRIDDDYFLCPKRLLSELPSRPKQNLVWDFSTVKQESHGWMKHLWYSLKISFRSSWGRTKARCCVIHMRTNKWCCGWEKFERKHTSTILGYIISLQRHMFLDLVKSGEFVTPI